MQASATTVLHQLEVVYLWTVPWRPRQQRGLESDDLVSTTCIERWATVYSADRYISARATPLATKSPRITLTGRGSTLVSSLDFRI